MAGNEGRALSAEEGKAALAGLACYIIWGIFPAYWKLLDEANPAEIIAHRVIWCFATTALIVTIARLDIRSLFRSARAWRILVPAAILVTANWSIYILGIAIDRIVEASIGYYLNPLMSILAGVIFFHERLTRLQIIAVALCTAGIGYFTLSYGHFPWIAIGVAATFATYGAVKKQGGYPPIEALAFENTMMLAPAIIFAFWLAAHTGTHVFFGDTASTHGWVLTGLLILGGPVTALPLVLFAKAANGIPLSMLGFIQYVTPTLQLLIGVFGYGEPFTRAHAICLGLIWLGIALVLGEGVAVARRQIRGA